MSSFSNFVALSESLYVISLLPKSPERYLMVLLPQGYEEVALKIFSKKKNANHCVRQMDQNLTIQKFGLSLVKREIMVSSIGHYLAMLLPRKKICRNLCSKTSSWPPLLGSTINSTPCAMPRTGRRLALEQDSSLDPVHTPGRS